MSQSENPYPHYKHFNETRSESQIQLAIRLTRCLTERNLQRISMHQPKINKSHKIKKEDFLYVYLHGVPILKQQYAGLNLPGAVVSHRLLAFDMSEQQLKENNYIATLREETQRLHRLIEKEANGRLVVFVSHSFGNFFLASYLHRYYNQKIVGLISIGGASVQAHKTLKELIQLVNNLSQKQLWQSMDAILPRASQNTLDADIFEVLFTKERLYAFFMAISKDEPFIDIFQKMRNFPRLLKCIIYGRKDNILAESLTSEMIIHYSYNQKFEEKYRQKIQRSWKEMYGKECDHIQDQFVYNIEGGHHSLHIQNKFKKTISYIIDEYLTVIEDSLNEEAKL